MHIMRYSDPEFNDLSRDIKSNHKFNKIMLHHDRELTSLLRQVCKQLEKLNRKLDESARLPAEGQNKPLNASKDDPGATSTPYMLHKKEAEEVLKYLNKQAGRKYQVIRQNLEWIALRLADKGVTVEGLKEMIDYKVLEWSGDSMMSKYLRPSTLFSRKRFFEYYADRHREPVINGSRNAGTEHDATRDFDAILKHQEEQRKSGN